MAKAVTKSKSIQAWEPPKIKGVLCTRVGIEFPEKKLPRATWERLNDYLHAFEDGFQWIRGDWWAYGDQEYGDRIKTLQEEDNVWFGGSRNYMTWSHWASCCKVWPLEKRHADVSFTHHAKLATEVNKNRMTMEKAEELLEWCETIDKTTGKTPSVVQLIAKVNEGRTLNEIGGKIEPVEGINAPTPPPTSEEAPLNPKVHAIVEQAAETPDVEPPNKKELSKFQAQTLKPLIEKVNAVKVHLLGIKHPATKRAMLLLAEEVRESLDEIIAENRPKPQLQVMDGGKRK